MSEDKPLSIFTGMNPAQIGLLWTGACGVFSMAVWVTTIQLNQNSHGAAIAEQKQTFKERGEWMKGKDASEVEYRENIKTIKETLAEIKAEIKK